MKQIYEVFKTGTFLAVALPGSKASKRLWRLMTPSTDALLDDDYPLVPQARFRSGGESIPRKKPKAVPKAKAA